MSILTIGTAAGILSILVAIAAMILGGYWSNRFSKLFRGGRMAFTSYAALASIPLWIALLFTNNLPFQSVNIVLYALALMWVGPATADVYDIARPNLR